jgi:putative nucleotidyltransferase with HDIG domain
VYVMQDAIEQLNEEGGESIGRPPLVLVRPGIGPAASAEPNGQKISGAPPLPRQAMVLSICVFVAGVAVVAFYAPQLPHSGLVGLVLLTLMAAASERLSIIAYRETWVSISFVSLFAIAALYGPAGVAVATPVAIFSLHFPRRMLPYRLMFNSGNSVLADVATALVLSSLLVGSSQITLSARVVIVALAASAANYGVRAVLISSVAGLATHQRPWTVWREGSQWLIPHYLVFGLLGLALAVAYQQIGVTGLLAFAAPPLMMRLAMKQYIDQTTRNVAILKRKNEQLHKANREILAMTDRLKETYDATLEALAAALDARDSETGGHSSRVTVYTMDMARELGVTENSDEWLDIERASLLHDVGKIGVSDAILNKPGPLTSEEWQQMRKHPAIGYEMLKDVKFLSTAADIVYAHHERYDGKGYPTGLKGEDVPLGARIFAVADAFDAMTSNRPYRRALSVDKAREEITSNSGTQFDPTVVKAFLCCLPEWSAGLKERGARAA